MALASLHRLRSLIVALGLIAAAFGLAAQTAVAQNAPREEMTTGEPKEDIVDEFFRLLHERRREEEAERQRLAAERAKQADTAKRTETRRPVTPNALARVEGTWVFDGMIEGNHLRIAVIFEENGRYHAGVRRFENGTVAEEIRDRGTFRLDGNSIAFFTGGERIDREFGYDAEKGLLWIGFPEWGHRIGFAPFEE